jgi:hypothetical protein
MRGRIAIGKRAIAGLRDQIAIAHDDAADRHLARIRGRVCLVEGEIHEGMRRHDVRAIGFAISNQKSAESHH